MNDGITNTAIMAFVCGLIVGVALLLLYFELTGTRPPGGQS